MNKYEKLIEYIVNDEQSKARALFHEIVVEKSRDIYESLLDDEHQHVGGDGVEGLVDEIGADEHGMHEEEEEFDIGGDDGMGDEMGGDFGGDEMGGDEFGGEGEGEGSVEDRVMDLETALDELKAEFDALMSDEEGEPEHNDGENDPDFGGDEGGDEFGGEEEGEESLGESAEEDEEEDDEEAVEESRRNMSSAERIREYVEKVSDGHGAEKGGQGEGHEVGKGGSTSVNKQGIVAKKNDMGGTTANIAKGGAEQAADGTTPKGRADGKLVKNAQEIDVAKRNVNKVGGNKGAQNYFSKKETSYEKAKGKEGQTTDGSVPVSKNSLVK